MMMIFLTKIEMMMLMMMMMFITMFITILNLEEVSSLFPRDIQNSFVLRKGWV